MQLNITDSKAGKAKGKLDVSDLAFGTKYNETLIHQIVTAYMADARAGTVAQKTRSEVKGGGKKPWRQKGTGRARAGTIRSPLWRKGGIIFAAKPRDYSQKVNRKMYRGALRSILSELVRLDRLHVVESLTVEQPKTKLLVQQLQAMKLDDVLIVIDNDDFNLMLAASNLPNVEVRTTATLDPVSLIKYEHVLFTVDAIKKVEGQLS